MRLRNLKHAVKTRSLDECEFSKSCGGSNRNTDVSTEWTRRKSLDENGGCRHTISKSLNPPKQLPPVGDGLATASESVVLLGHLHSKHQRETVGGVTKIGSIPDDTKLNRERIERYKQERRKELHEK